MANQTQFPAPAAANLKDKTFVPLIWVFSGVVTAVVAILLFIPKEGLTGALNVSFLPTLNATLNSLVSILLVVAFVWIRQGKMKPHKNAMLLALGLSALFLVSYVIYHTFAPSTKFGGEGTMRYIYFFILLTHITLATIVLPLALFTAYRSLKGDYAKHKRIARWTFPIWLYVSVSGVLVYLMISPYYQH